METFDKLANTWIVGKHRGKKHPWDGKFGDVYAGRREPVEGSAAPDLKMPVGVMGVGAVTALTFLYLVDSGRVTDPPTRRAMARELAKRLSELEPGSASKQAMAAPWPTVSIKAINEARFERYVRTSLSKPGTINRHCENVLSLSGNGYPDPAVATTLLRLFCELCEERFNLGAELFDRLLRSSPESVDALLQTLGTHLKAPDAIPSSSKPSALPPQNEVKSRFCDVFAQRFADLPRAFASDMQSAVDDIVWRLQNLAPENRLLCITGSSYSGRKSAVVQALTELEIIEANPSARAKLLEGSEVPIFCMSCSSMTYSSLIESVYEFLVLSGRDRLESDSPYRYRSTSALTAQFRRIAEYAHYIPAVYIFADLPLMSRERSEPLIMDSGVRRLTEALLGGHEQTRIIITGANERLEDDYFIGTPFQHAHCIEVASPTISSLIGRLRNSANFSETWTRRNRLQPIDGGAVALLCAVAKLDDNFVLGEDFNFSDALAAAAAHLVEALYNSTSTELFFLVCAMSVSVDGITETSIGPILAHETTSNAQPTYGSETAMRDLEALSQRTGASVFRVSKPRTIVPYEIMPGEQAPATTFLVDLSVRRELNWALFQKAPETWRRAASSIASRARERALATKILIDGTYGRVRSDIRRDVQAFQALVASVDPVSDAEDAQESSLVLIPETRVFGPAREATAAETIRFAYRIMLRRDIDRDHRLTLSLDEDRLRAQLYSAIILGVGSPDALFGSSRKALPTSVSDMVQAALSAKEIGELLATILIASHFCADVERIRWASELAENCLKESDHSADLALALAPLWSAEIDTMLLLGGDFRAAPHERRLSSVVEYCNVRLKMLSVGSVQDEAERERQRLRIRLRQVEARALVCSQSSEVVAEFGTLLDSDFLIGRGSRRLLRYLLIDHNSYGLGLRLLEKYGVHRRRLNAASLSVDVWDLITFSTGRLGRYMGADRVNILADLARYQVTQGSAETALKLIERADQIVLSTGVSPATRFEKELASLEILLDSWPMRPDKSLLDRTEIRCKRLIRACDQLDLPVFSTRANLLLAGIHLQNAAMQSDWGRRRIETTKADRVYAEVATLVDVHDIGLYRGSLETGHLVKAKILEDRS